MQTLRNIIKYLFYKHPPLQYPVTLLDQAFECELEIERIWPWEQDRRAQLGDQADDLIRRYVTATARTIHEEMSTARPTRS